MYIVFAFLALVGGAARQSPSPQNSKWLPQGDGGGGIKTAHNQTNTE